jgi:hypothetical protein
MNARVLRMSLWAVLCAGLLWGMLDYRSADPNISSYSVMHLATLAMAVLAMLAGTRALFGASSRMWDLAFLALALLPAVLFGAKNLVLRRECGLGELATFAMVLVAIWRLWRPDVRGVLGGSFRDGAKVILVNVAIVVGILLVSEGFARLLLSKFDPAQRTLTQYGTPFWLQFQPFLMFSMDGPTDFRFSNARRPGEDDNGHLVTNNMGFRMTEPVRFDSVRPKAPGERVVLFTGGSAAWGAGATSNEATIAARLQAILNESQTSYKYVVISLSSGGWISFQSMLAITLYGLNFDPDWVVAMDGDNDIIGACSEGYGAGRDGYSYVFDRYSRSYLYHQAYPPFYRGVSENALVRVSALYRILTQQRYVPGPAEYTAKWNEVERALAFYELSYDRLFRTLSASQVKVLLSSQPYKNLYRADFEAGPDALRKIAEKYEGSDCRSVPHLERSRYFHPRLKQVSQQLIARWKARIDVRYLSMSELIPQDPEARPDFFWGGSTVHMVDRGQDFVARIYARTILEADLPQQKAQP